ncbi:CPBP family intramembrane glutamic endopeptidase [Erythrobacter sp. THAF29]|uniref:CPBP family intramembrane glutamic endopeptidase n=1 Tax=Erythrobacter sp. THAF29 TaxID=2587851 RepID=UPI001267F1FA|nr:CPBP family intramembrane glutamic endopeptidase [Erythrobacter sp. THAF29]QFT76033.1 CAAX amino terminal protease self- immunity [Erythrobacter sp. THAF29]
MTGESTSPTLGESRPIGHVQTVRGEWRKFFAFLKSPGLPQTTAQTGDAAKGMARMLGLDIIIMTVFIGVLMAIVSAGFELPENLNASLELNLTTVGLVVVLAPILEELGFRSWLSGKPGHVFGLLAFAVVTVLVATLLAAGGFSVADDPISSGLAGLGIGIVFGTSVAVMLVLALRNRPPLGWFVQLFPAVFWLSALAFGLIHLLNYPEEGVFWLALPLVIPQFVLGTILGYVRVHYGLWTAIVLHALHNGFALSVAALAMENGIG